MHHNQNYGEIKQCISVCAIVEINADTPCEYLAIKYRHLHEFAPCVWCDFSGTLYVGKCYLCRYRFCCNLWSQETVYCVQAMHPVIATI